jgi:hypothetical protein
VHDDWLKRRGRVNQASEASLTCVVAEDGGAVIGTALLHDAVFGGLPTSALTVIFSVKQQT